MCKCIQVIFIIKDNTEICRCTLLLILVLVITDSVHRYFVFAFDAKVRILFGLQLLYLLKLKFTAIQSIFDFSDGCISADFIQDNGVLIEVHLSFFLLFAVVVFHVP